MSNVEISIKNCKLELYLNSITNFRTTSIWFFNTKSDLPSTSLISSNNPSQISNPPHNKLISLISYLILQDYFYNKTVKKSKNFSILNLSHRFIKSSELVNDLNKTSKFSLKNLKSFTDKPVLILKRPFKLLKHIRNNSLKKPMVKL